MDENRKKIVAFFRQRRNAQFDIKDCKVWADEKMKAIVTWLNQNCHTRKDPQIFCTKS